MSVYTDMTSAFYYKKLLTWQDMDRMAENDAYLLGNRLAPGAVIWWLTASTPDGYAKLDGGAISRTGVGAALFALWGTKYGAGDGSSTFNVMNMGGRIPMGAGAGSGLTVRALDDSIGNEAESASLAEGTVSTGAQGDKAVGTLDGVGAEMFTGNGGGAQTFRNRKFQTDAFDVIPPVHVGHWIVKL